MYQTNKSNDNWKKQNLDNWKKQNLLYKMHKNRRSILSNKTLY